MEEQHRKTRYRLAVALIIVLSLTVRLLDVYRGYPYLSDPAEIRMMAVADSMVHRLDPIPCADGPAAPAALAQSAVLGAFCLWQFIWGNVAAIEDIRPTLEAGYSHPEWFLWGRALSALFGMLTVYITYLLARRFFGRRSSLMAAGLMAVASLHIEYSARLSGEALATMLITASLLAIVRLREKKSRRRYIGAGAVAGLAISATPVAVLLAVPLVWAHFERGGTLRRRTGFLLLALVAMGLSIVLSTPRAMVSPWEFTREVAGALASFAAHPVGRTTAGWSMRAMVQQGLSRLASFSESFGTAALMPLGGMGVLLMARRLGRRAGVLAVFATPYAAMAIYAIQINNAVLLPLLPLWSISAGLGVSWFIGPAVPPGQWVRQRFVPVMALIGGSWFGLWLLMEAVVRRDSFDPGAVIRLHIGMGLMVSALLLQGYASLWWDSRRRRRWAVLPGVLLLSATLCLAIFMAIQIGLDTAYHWPFRVVFLGVAMAAVTLAFMQKGVGFDWSRWAVVVGTVLLLLGPNIGAVFNRFQRRHNIEIDTRMLAARFVNERLPGGKVAVQRELAIHLPTLTEVEAAEFGVFTRSVRALYDEGFTHALVGVPSDPMFDLIEDEIIRYWGGRRLDPLGRTTSAQTELLQSDDDPRHVPPTLVTNPALRLMSLRKLPWLAIDIHRFVGSRAAVRYDDTWRGIVMAEGDSAQSHIELPVGPAVLRLLVRVVGQELGQPWEGDPIELRVSFGQEDSQPFIISDGLFHYIDIPFDQATRTQQLVIQLTAPEGASIVLAQALVSARGQKRSF